MKTNQLGFTLIETLISVFLVSILILGLTIQVTNLKEYMRRSEIERMFDQYCNDVIEYISKEIKNSDSIEIRHTGRDIDKITLYQRNILSGKKVEKIYSATKHGVYQDRSNKLIFLVDLENLKQITWNLDYNLLYFNVNKVYDERDRFTDDFTNSFYEVSIGIEINVDDWIIVCNNVQRVEMPNYNLLSKE